VERAQKAGLCRAGDPMVIATSLMWSVVGSAFHDVMTGAGRPFASDAARTAHVDHVWALFRDGAVPPEGIAAARG
jgi:hypothetical protein